MMVIEYVALDFETTGLNHAVDEVISFGAIPIVGGRIDLSRCVYQETAHGRPGRGSGVTVHGLRPADLTGKVERSELEDCLAGALEGRQIVAWAAWVEAGFLASIFGGRDRVWRSRIIDVIDLVAKLDKTSGWRDAGEEGLVACCARFGVPHARAHHALGDALMTAELFLVVARRLAGLGLGDPEDLAGLGSGRRR